MLNIFPIQFLAPLAYFLLRLCVGVIFLYVGTQHIKHKNHKTLTLKTNARGPVVFVLIGILEISTGILFMLGAYTQIAALMGLSVSLLHILKQHFVSYTNYPPRMFFTLLFVASLSLFITGAGVFAFDLPL